jgi:hypothetical protein
MLVARSKDVNGLLTVDGSKLMPVVVGCGKK